MRYVFLIVCLFAAPARSVAEESGPLTAETQALAEKIKEIKESKKGLVEAEAQKRKILGSLYVINQRMKKITQDKGSLTNDLLQTQDSVKNIAKIIAGLEGQIDKQRTQLRKRLRALYKLSGQGYLGILFSRENSGDFDETLRFLKIVTDNDYLLIRSYQQNIASYKAQKNKLRGQVERLVGIEKNIKRQEGLLASEHLAKSKIVSALDHEKIVNLNRIKSIRAQNASQSLSDLLKPSIFEQKGQLPQPIAGTVVQDFGLTVDEKYKIQLSHKGWRYTAPRGTSVSSIYDGTVVYSEWVDGYGNTVIIDHGDHYYTVYGQLAQVKVHAGDVLKKGDALGEAGAANANQGAGLYFEIRHFSEPENPTGWITNKKSLQQASIASSAAD